MEKNTQLSNVQREVPPEKIYEIDKKFELQNKKYEEASNVMVGNYTLSTLSMLAEKFAKAGDLIPKEFQNQPEKCFIAIYKGAILGIDAFTAIQRIAVINGRATIWGDTALSLVRNSNKLEKFKEEIIEDGDNIIARCTVQRVGEEQHVSEFSKKDAEIAGLWDEQKKVINKYGKEVPNPSPWFRFPKRMLKYRARAFALRDIFSDIIDGLYIKEEMEEGENFNKKEISLVINCNEISEEESNQINEIQEKFFNKNNQK